VGAHQPLLVLLVSTIQALTKLLVILVLVVLTSPAQAVPRASHALVVTIVQVARVHIARVLMVTIVRVVRVPIYHVLQEATVLVEQVHQHIVRLGVIVLYLVSHHVHHVQLEDTRVVVHLLALLARLDNIWLQQGLLRVMIVQLIIFVVEFNMYIYII
jgi:hypothetical protein